MSIIISPAARRLGVAALAAAALAAPLAGALAHGDVTPQAVDTRALPQLGATWHTANPYRVEAGTPAGTPAKANAGAKPGAAAGAGAQPDAKAASPAAPAEAVRIGASGYTQNCARCHGLDAVSGGIAPDLRKLDADCSDLADAAKKSACYKEMDSLFIQTVRNGRTRDGRVYMPPFEGTLSQEAMWAIKTYLETRREP